MEKSNCDQVLKLTKDLRQAGNKSCYGVIDWDLTNSDNDYVFVHGYKNRYSIENFIFDPLYLCISFIEDDCVNGISDLGYNKTFNQYSLIDASDDKLQTLVNWVVEKIIMRFSSLKKEFMIEISYANGRKVKIPEWYLVMNGHEQLEGKLKEVFPSLKQC